jgi:hypothetical protein
MNLIRRINSIIEPIFDYQKEIVDGKFFPHGIVTCEHFRKGKLIDTQTGENTFTTEGIAKILNTFFGSLGKAASPICYCGLFKANITPVVGDTAAKLGSGNAYGECQDADYTPATNKPSYVIASTATAACTNSASKAEFTMAAQITVYGTFLSLGQAKVDTTGPLVCAKRFTNPRAVEIGDVLAITYGISVTTS